MARKRERGPVSAPHERFVRYGWQYHAEEGVVEEDAPDLAWYRSYLGTMKGPVLDAGCGSGRLALPLARSGADVTAVDASEPLLRILRQRRADEPAEVRSRLHTHRSDLRRLRLGRRFPVILCANGTLGYFASEPELRQAAASLRRHGAPGAFLLADLKEVNPKLRRGETIDSGWGPAHVDPESGDAVRKRVRVRMRGQGDQRRLRLDYTFRHFSADGRLHDRRNGLDSLALSNREVVRILGEEGWILVVGFEDFGEEPFRFGSARTLAAVLVKAPETGDARRRAAPIMAGGVG